MSNEIPEGFTPHEGRENPAPGQLVYVVFRDGWTDKNGHPSPSESWGWENDPDSTSYLDIIAYRVKN